MTKTKATSGNRKLYTRSLNPPFFLMLDLDNFKVYIKKFDDKWKVIEGPCREFTPETTISQLDEIIQDLLQLAKKETQKAKSLMN
jgi:hypothetical protein